MQRVGTVSKTAQNLAIIHCDGEDHPDIGTSVVDESLSRVGRVVDVFGPVSQPYVAVATDSGVLLTDLLGQKLYAR
ncbi:RNA-binding protein [Halogranum gelatinilyticum]|jgi:RNA-binding protein|uniref:RNA-binding protein n=1 Tax=Halogranum gelatinilyticum TaxID=660521 RepID=A0A1G9QXS1_9EURY|nr:Gar1/Naf1 family protein [Halogranum gelatinilyticum]SDM15045.1 RNA-binding protein [Halogranum gelatinilyticum]